MALLTSDVVLDEAMDRFELNTVIMKMADGRYSKAWDESPTKGDHVTVRLPVYARGRRGEAADPQVIDERPATLYIPAAFGSDSLLTDRQLSLDLNDFKSQVLNPHIDRISSDVASAACEALAMNVSQFTGVPGTTPTTYTTYNDADTILSQSGTPHGIGERNMLVDAKMGQKAAEAGYQFFNEPVEISRQYTTGTMGIQGGAKWWLEQALYQHTVGALGGDPKVNGAVANGKTVVIDGCSNSIVKWGRKGDKVQFTGSYMVHPTNGRVYGDLAFFTLAEDVDTDGSGNATLTLTEAIEFGTPYANVSAIIADNADVVVWGKTGAAAQATIAGKNTTLGVRMHKDALVYASPNLELPADVDKLSGRTRSDRMKIGMRVWRASDVRTGERITRLDLLCGFLVAQPRKACLVCSA